jgi:iron complex outermembrane recepter protein
MNMKNFVLAGLVLAVGIQGAYAEEAYQLEKVTVTSFRYQEILDRTPSQATVITQEDIKQSNATRIIDVLRPVPGVVVRDLFGNGTQASVDMAGFGEQGALNVLVLVDGRRANNADLSGVSWNQIPLDHVERIEIVQGGGIGVLYGDNAASGVINIITKKGKGPFHGKASVEVGSYAFNKQSLSLGGDWKEKLSYWLSASRNSANGYRHNSFNKDSDFSSKWGYEFTDMFKLRFDSGFHASTYGLPGAIYKDNNRIVTGFFPPQNTIDRDGRTAARFGNDHANTKDYYFVAGVDTDFQEAGKIETDFSYRRTNNDSYYLSSGLYTRKNQTSTHGITPKYTLFHSVLGKENKLVTGMDYYRTFFNSDNFDPADDKLIQNLTRIHKTSAAGYIHDELSILEPLVAVGGYRYEMAHYNFNYHDFSLFFPNPDIAQKQTHKMKAYNLGLIYTYAPESNVFWNTSKSFRFPVVDEFTYQDASFLQQLNTNLQPQKSTNYQVGVRHNFFDRLKSELSAFWMNVRNEIYFNAAGGPLGAGQNQNYDRTIHRGLQTASEFKVCDYASLWGNYTLTQATFDGGVYDKNEIPLVPRHKISLGQKFMLPGNWTWNMVENYVGRRYFLNDQANTYSRQKAYMTLDSNVSYVHKAWTFTLAVNNILNHRHSEYAGVRLTNDSLYGYRIGDKFFYPSPGTNANFKVDYSF